MIGQRNDDFSLGIAERVLAVSVLIYPVAVEGTISVQPKG